MQRQHQRQLGKDQTAHPADESQDHSPQKSYAAPAHFLAALYRVDQAKPQKHRGSQLVYHKASQRHRQGKKEATQQQPIEQFFQGETFLSFS